MQSNQSAESNTLQLQAQPAAPPPPTVPTSSRPAPIAHAAHTLAFLLILLLTTVFGHLRTAPSVMDATPHMTRFLSSILYEWLLLGAVVAGIYHRRAFFTEALASCIPGPAKSMLLGAGIYLAGLFAIGLVSAALAYTPLRSMHNSAILHAMLPGTLPQLAVWFLVSLTAGVCEELIFRGYLQQQFAAWTGRPILSVVLAGIIFGSIHLYEGAAAILPIAALGMVYGFVVLHFRGDLRAVIVAHTLQDFLTALFVYTRSQTVHPAPPLHALMQAHAFAQNISSFASFFS